MSQKSSFIEEVAKPADCLRRGGRPPKSMNSLSVCQINRAAGKFPVSENNISFEKEHSLGRLREGKTPAGGFEDSPKSHHNKPLFHLPSVTKSREIVARQNTFDIFVNRRTLKDPDASNHWDYHSIKKNASLEQIQHLSNVAKRRSLHKPRTGVMYINELWDDRHYRKMLRKSGIQEYKEEMEKLNRISLLERKRLLMEEVGQNSALILENKGTGSVALDAYNSISEENQRASLAKKSRRPSIEEGIEQSESTKLNHNKINSWSEQSNTSMCLPNHQKYYHSLVEKDLGNSSINEDDHSKMVNLLFILRTKLYDNRRFSGSKATGT